MKRAVVFDLDGTLCDSIGTVVATAEASFRAHDLPAPDRHVLQRAIGLPLSEVLRLAARAPVPDLDALTETYRGLYVPIALDTERLFPGIKDALAALRRAGHPLAVATGKSHAGAIAACTRLGLVDAVDAVHGILPGTPGKPDPAVLWRALADLDRAPTEAVVVGDSPYDLQMARAAGAEAWAVTWGGHPAEELAAQGPDASFDQLDSLLARLLAGG